MKIFLAGGTGAVGQQLVPLLVKHGHRVFATTRSPEKAAGLRAAGAWTAAEASATATASMRK